MKASLGDGDACLWDWESSHSCRRFGRKRAFTLVELLVVVAIIGVLVALLLPAIQAAREAARRSQCANNLRQMALAMQNYHDSLKVFPAGAMVSNQLSWNCLILPFMEQAALHDRFVELGTFNRGTFNGGTNNEGANKANLLSLTKVETFLCPSALRDFATHGSARMSNPERMGYASHYEGVAGPVGVNPVTGRNYPHDPEPSGHGGFALSGVLHRDSGVRMGQIVDGTSSTLLIGEISNPGGDGANWVRGMGTNLNSPNGSSAIKNIVDGINLPNPSGFNNQTFKSLHPGGAQFALADGSVVILADTIDLQLYRALSSRDGGEAVTVP